MTRPNRMPAWYVLHTRSRFENKVNEGLERKSKEVFLPKMLVAGFVTVSIASVFVAGYMVKLL